MPVKITPLSVRRSLFVKAAPERVWQEFSNVERFGAWFGTGHRLLTYEPWIGGWVELEVDIDGEPVHFGGAVVALDVNQELTFEDDWIPNQGWDAPTLLTLRLTPAYDGTIVELFHHGFERTGDGATDAQRGFEGGWGLRQLEALRQIIEGK